MWGDIAIGVVVIGFVGAISKWQYSRVGKVEENQRKALYQPDGQTNYVPRGECKATKEAFCDKVDEVKALIIQMNEKREDEKDDYHKEQQNIAVRLAGIDAKLP